MINRMLQGKQPIIYGDGQQKRCFSFVGDVLFCLEKIIIPGQFDKEIINVGPDEEYITINELAGTIAELLGFTLKPIYLNKRPLEVKYANCSADKARRLLGYQTKTSLRDGLTEMIGYIKERGVRDFNYDAVPVEIQNERTPKTWSEKMI
jgi:UDP-glucose 4-epimerase